MKKIYSLIILLLLLSGCGQLHPTVDSSTILRSEPFRHHNTFEISQIDFETQLLASALFEKIPVDGCIYKYNNAEIVIDLQCMDDGSIASIQLVIDKARPLQNKEYALEVHQALRVLIDILAPNTYQFSLVEDILTIRTIKELNESKVVQLGEAVVAIATIQEYVTAEFVYSIIFNPMYPK